MSSNISNFTLQVQRIMVPFFQAITARDPFDLSTAQKVADLIRNALFQASPCNGYDFTNLLYLSDYSIDLDSIFDLVSAVRKFSKPNEPLLLNLMNIADLYDHFRRHPPYLTDSDMKDLTKSLWIENRSFMRVEPLITLEDKLVESAFDNLSENPDWKAISVLNTFKNIISITKRNGDFSYLLKFHGHLKTHRVTKLLQKPLNEPLAKTSQEILSISETLNRIFFLYEEICTRVLFRSSISRKNIQLIQLGNIGDDVSFLDDHPIALEKIIPLSSRSQEKFKIFSETIEKMDLENDSILDSNFGTSVENVLKLLNVAIFSHASLYGDFSFLLRFQYGLFDLKKLDKLIHHLKKNPDGLERLIKDLDSISTLYKKCLTIIRLFKDVTSRVLSSENIRHKNPELIHLGRYVAPPVEDKSQKRSKKWIPKRRS